MTTKRVGLLVGVTLAEVLVGLWVVRPIGGTAREYGIPTGTFQPWVWPTICIAGLTVIWLSTLWWGVMRPLRNERLSARIRDHRDPRVTTTQGAQGWYEDPYRTLQDRWFSGGKPSALVRDGEVESKDPPPDTPYVGKLSPASAGEPVAYGVDLQRAGDRRKPDSWDVAADASTWFPTS
jgi:hypothetical protein